MQICEQPEITIAVECRIKHGLNHADMQDLGWYLSRILMRFPQADLRACAARWMQGKRAVTLPGHKSAQRAACARRKSLRLDTPRILAALELVDQSLLAQYAAGNHKVLNAIVGKVIAHTKAEPGAVRTVVFAQLNQQSSG